MTTIANSDPATATRVRLTTPCHALCPHSGEPQAGSVLMVTYQPGAVLLELHALQAWLREQSEGETALDLETLTQRAAQWAAQQVGTAVEIEARYVLRGGLEMTVWCRS